ncbi:hypothetical protein [Streptomyces sp. NPDC096132]|uniref:hypothetical protein n=1 Tax=Streptomyces sp. NPDC096132 TaxID=3366075 RepID=UPI0038133122
MTSRSTTGPQALTADAEDVAAVRAGALPIGEEHGLPLVRFPLEHTADAHRAVEGGAVGRQAGRQRGDGRAGADDVRRFR